MGQDGMAGSLVQMCVHHGSAGTTSVLLLSRALERGDCTLFWLTETPRGEF